MVEILETIGGRKALVLDPRLSGPLGLVFEVSLLRKNGVENIFILSPDGFTTECENIIFLCRPQVELMKVSFHLFMGHF
jgi:vacuolar protein sorting-associated protein 33A